MMDLSSPTPSYRDRKGHVIEEKDDETLVYNTPSILKTYKSEEFLTSPNPSYASLKKLSSPHFLRSTESISSGYCSDFLQSSADLQPDENLPGHNIDQENRRWEDQWRAVRESRQKLTGQESHHHVLGE